MIDSYVYGKFSLVRDEVQYSPMTSLDLLSSL